MHGGGDFKLDRQIDKWLHPRFGLFYVIFFVFSLVCAKFSIGLSAIGIVLCVLLYAARMVHEQMRRRALTQYISTLPISLNDEISKELSEFPMPVVVALAETGEIIWCNGAFTQMTGQPGVMPQIRLQQMIEGFQVHWLLEGKKQYPDEARIGEQYFQVFGNLTRAEVHKNALMVLYFMPCTEMVMMRRQYESTRPVVSIISIDNYEELTKNATDTEKSLLLAGIDRKISEWTQNTNALLRKYDRDKYIFVTTEEILQRLCDEKFTVLDAVQTIQSRDGVTATLSIGIGKDGATIAEDYNNAALALEMSLSRGGDQAVIKNKYAFEFFGGLSKEIEKSTKVKSRVVANALSQLMRDSSQVLVMGHASSDMDAFGAAIGMALAARNHEKPVHIVLDAERTLAGELLQKMKELPSYKGVFISPEEAMVMCDFNTLLIVVDTNRPDYVESPPLLQSINKIAVIDHHRRAASYIDNSALNLHEPYASSTCELVSELLQYMVPNRTILREEAECMLAGIYLDTKGFSVKAGVRTFEAAAYLKRAGAEMTEVKKLFQSTFDAYMARQKIISTTHTAANGIVMAVSGVHTSRIIAAQAADELLNIMSVRASVVAIRDGADMIISARSLGKVNVQILMEKLGGGGNLSSAGAQLTNTSPEEAEERITAAIKEYSKEYES